MWKLWWPIGLVRTLVRLVPLAAVGCGPWASSDVPTTDRIGWYPHQDDIRITGFTAETVGDTQFGLFGSGKGLVRLHIVGSLEDRHGLPPYISKVQLAEYFDAPTAKAGHLLADVVVTPVADEHDGPPPYDRLVGPVSFDVKVERVLETYQWGPNVFRFRCGDFEQEVSLQQSK